jgi:hypothetical protein
MVGYRRSIRLAAGVVAVALLGAAQPPASVPPPAAPVPSRPAVPLPPPDVPTAPGIQPSGPPSVLTPPGLPPQPVVPAVRQFNLKIDPKATAKDLLPPDPKTAAPRGPVAADDLAAVPEVEFAAKPARATTDEKLVEQAAHQLARINHLNAKKADAFMAALLESRPDLAGMPFAMGGACRTAGDKLKYFSEAARTVRQALGGNSVSAPTPSRASGLAPAVEGPTGTVVVANFSGVQTAGVIQGFAPLGPPQPFWQQYATLCEQVDAARGRTDKETAEHVAVARVAALTQMLAVEPAEVRLGLAKYLAGVPHVDATRALARMAIYSAETDVREAALTALKVRREKDYTDVLVTGLRYPWPAVARRSADAIAKLERADLIPELLNVLDAADPRLPAAKAGGGTSGAVVREVVKVNHHRNCVMCHAPAGSGVPNPNAITAEVAVPGQPLPLPSEGYRQSTPELMIRVDVTYLRPDFSAALPVADAHPWPEAQRFDFLVRERTLSADEAAAYREKLTPKEAGVFSPYHKAAVAALREMTGKDAAPTARAWRELLAAPAPR